MSLFQAREWWTTWCGDADEEFDQGSLVIGNIDNSTSGHDKIATGSLNGFLRIYVPQADGFKAEHLMLELQMNNPILQLAVGKFVPGSDNIQLAILQPRTLSVHNVTAVTGSVEHGNHYTISLMYEHRLERTAASMIHGPFGNVTGKDFLCVMSMDGVFTFYEQETFSFNVHLPNFLLPGPFAYVSATDSFVVGTSARFIESYRYQVLASASQTNGKKINADWSKSIGDHVLSFQVLPTTLAVLCEHSFYLMNFSSEIQAMKKLEYNPSCLYAYPNPKNANDLMVLIGTFSKSLQIYKGIQLNWAAQLPEVPMCCKVAKFEDLSGAVVTINEYGHLYCSYLGTDPALFVAPNVEFRHGDFDELNNELKSLNAFIKEAELGEDNLTADALDDKEDLEVDVLVPDHNDKISMCPDTTDDEEGSAFPSVTARIVLRCKRIKVIENITLMCAVKFPLVCTEHCINVTALGDKGPELTFEVSFYTIGDSIPSDLQLTVTASYTSESDAPRVVQAKENLPFCLVCIGNPPIKQARHKFTVDTNKEPVNLADLFPEMVDVAVPVSVIGLRFIANGPVVTVITSKQSNRYRIQSDQFEAVWLVLDQLLKRLHKYFEKHEDGGKFEPSFAGPIPLVEYFELIDYHFEIRLSMENFKRLLQQRAHQFRVVQKRLLTRFKDKTPSPLQHLDTLLDGTYKQLLALGEEYENSQVSLKHASNALSSATNLINGLIKLYVSMKPDDFDVLQACLSPVVFDATDQGWEEITNNNIAYLFRTCLAKSIKEQNNTLPSLKMEANTSKLKKNISTLVERLNKGASLSLINDSSKISRGKIKETRSRTSQDEAMTNEIDFEGNELGKRLLIE